MRGECEDVKGIDCLVERYAMQNMSAHLFGCLCLFLSPYLYLARMIPISSSFIHKTSPLLLFLIHPFPTVLILLSQFLFRYHNPFPAPIL